MNKKYRTSRYVCPFCGSDNTFATTNNKTDEYGYSFDAAFVYHYRWCGDCRTTYRITYKPCKAERI